jgi:tetratricopeptide (TPR) repeat protein
MVIIRGKDYTLEDAYNFAAQELSLRNFQSAADIYTRIIAKFPNHAEVYNSLGVSLQEMGRYDDAIAQYDTAIAMKPEYAEPYSNRGGALQTLKRFDEAFADYSKAIALKPGFAKAYNNCGVTLQELQRYEDALAHYTKAITLEPDFAEAYSNRSITLHTLLRYEQALADAEKAIALYPRYSEAHANRAGALQKLKRFEEALASCETAIALRPDYAIAYQTRGLILVNKGDMAEAERMFLKALDIQPDFPDPVFSLAGIRKYKDADDANIAHIKAQIDDPHTSLKDKEHLYFSLGKIYDDCGLYDEAFECYTHANRIFNASVAYNPGQMSHITDSFIAVFNKDFLSEPFPFASQSRTPIFVVGMPRSGTTLMASSLSNHPLIGTAGELPNLTQFTLRLPELLGGGVFYPQAARDITPAIAAGLEREYEDRLRRDIGTAVPHVVDKHPLNFRHLGLIRKLFPQAKVVHCMRHPLDTCLSNYFQRFSIHYDYSFDLANIGHFYNEYIRLMAHWRQVLPAGMMLEVHYEDMIADTERTTRSILQFLGLEWDAACMTPHTNTAPVETASQWQVRQPIYTQSVERWRHYDKHLGPLKKIIGV